MPTSAGSILYCSSPHCRCQMQLPSRKELLSIIETSPDVSQEGSRLWIACPSCLGVREYGLGNVQPVEDDKKRPFLTERRVLFSVHFGCAERNCGTQARIFVIAATTSNIPSLLDAWHSWIFFVRCEPGHLLKPPPSTTWWIQREVDDY